MSIKWYKFELQPKRNSQLAKGCLLGVGGLLYLKLWLPVTNIPVPCVFHELTGLYCPGCGMTRTALSLLNLDIYQAFRYNLLAFLIPPLFIAYSLANKKQMRWVSRLIMAVMLTVTLMYGLLRNLPALEWLAPTTVH